MRGVRRREAGGNARVLLCVVLLGVTGPGDEEGRGKAARERETHGVAATPVTRRIPASGTRRGETGSVGTLFEAELPAFHGRCRRRPPQPKAKATQKRDGL